MKKFISLSIFIIFSLNIIAQDDGFYGPSGVDPKISKKEQRQKNFERWSFGGNFWLSFGSEAYVELSPVVLYKATPRLMVGGGFTYIYSKYNNVYYDSLQPYNQSVSSSIYGPRIVVEYTLFSNLNEKININIGNIVLHSEYAILETDRLYRNIYTNEIIYDGRVWTNNLLIGGGIYQPFGNRGGVSIVVLFNVIENKFSPYTNPIFRLGFYF